MNTASSTTVLPWKRRALTVLLLAAAALLSAPIVADANVDEKAGDSPLMGSASQVQELKEKWGVELLAMRSTAEGHMIDFRYRVLDADKAAPLFERLTKPYLINEASGKVLAVPNTAKIGSLRNSNMPQQGRIYWMFFGNHHREVKKGDKVTVAIGDFRAINLIVE